MIRVGLVGAGPWAGRFHAPLIAATPSLELAGVWARRLDAAQELAARYDSAAVSTFEGLLEHCDAVAFCVPPDVQAPLAVQAARAGKHLLLEKPVAFTVSAAQGIADAVDAAGVVTQIVLTNRYSATVRSLLAELSGRVVRGVVGDFITASAMDGSPFATPWRREDGAALPDLGPHALDLLGAIGGKIDEVRAVESGGVIALMTRHASGAVGQLTLSVTTPGTDGPLRCTVYSDAGAHVLGDPDPESPAVRRTIGDEFAAAVTGQASQPLDVHHAVALQRVLTAAARSLVTDAPVVVAEAAGPGRAGEAPAP